MSDDNYRNPSREAKHLQDLLNDNFSHLGALAGQEDRIGATLGTEEAGIYQSFQKCQRFLKVEVFPIISFKFSFEAKFNLFWPIFLWQNFFLFLQVLVLKFYIFFFKVQNIFSPYLIYLNFFLLQLFTHTNFFEDPGGPEMDCL